MSRRTESMLSSILRVMKRYRLRRLIMVIIILLVAAMPFASGEIQPFESVREPTTKTGKQTLAELGDLQIKGRAPKTGYSRQQFGDGWDTLLGCDTRERILLRDLTNITISPDCKIMSGQLHDPYTGKIIHFLRGAATSAEVQIDHVVALSNAWQTGAQGLAFERRVMLANDPLNLLAVDGDANQQKSDGDAATWLPSNKSFRCQYVSRQVEVKNKYELWVTQAEHDAIVRVLSKC